MGTTDEADEKKSKLRFTDLGLSRMKPPKEGRATYWDTDLPGFGMRVSATGSRSFFLMARLPKRQGEKTARQVRLTIDTKTYPKVGDARDRARQLLRDIEAGKDPTALAPKVVTVKEVAAEFIKRHARPNTKTWQSTEKMLAARLLPAFGDRDIKSITRAEMRKLLHDLTDTGMGAGVNRVRAGLSKLFNWAADNDYIDVSPLEGVDKPVQEVSRDRVLPRKELTLVWKAAEVLGVYPAAFVKLLILTAQRRSEVSDMTWGELDLPQRLWVIPAERSKNGIAHQVPLSDQAVEVLTALPRMNSAFVFPAHRAHGGRDRPISGFNKIKARLDRRVAELAVEAGDVGPDGQANVKPWRLHDLRRTAATGMIELGVAYATLSRVLNHSEGGVTKIYARHSFLPEKKAALEKWGAYVERLTNPAVTAEVIPFPAAAG